MTIHLESEDIFAMIVLAVILAAVLTGVVLTTLSSAFEARKTTVTFIVATTAFSLVRGAIVSAVTHEPFMSGFDFPTLVLWWVFALALGLSLYYRRMELLRRQIAHVEREMDRRKVQKPIPFNDRRELSHARHRASSR